MEFKGEVTINRGIKQSYLGMDFGFSTGKTACPPSVQVGNRYIHCLDLGILLSHLSIIGTLIRKIFRKNNSSALCCVQEIGEPYNLDHNDA